MQSVKIRLVLIYRIPPSPANAILKKQFITEYTQLLDKLSTDTCKLIILGDYNVHYDKLSDPETANLLETSTCYNLTQHVSEPTHIAGHTIDLLYTRSDDDLITSCKTDTLLSDHFAIHFSIKVGRPHPKKKVVISRKLASIDSTNFSSDIKASELFAPMNASIAAYNCVLSQLLDKHAPQRERKFVE